MADKYTLKIVQGQHSTIQEIDHRFATKEEAQATADELLIGANDAVMMYINGKNPQPIRMGKDWPR